MKTTPECLSCFQRQVEYTAKISADSLKIRDKIRREAAKLIADLNLDRTPPENAMALYRLITEISGNSDPFAGLKEASNLFALDLKNNLQEKIRNSKDSLLTAVKLAIAGNIIDYGAHHVFDAAKTIGDCLSKELFIDDFQAFKKDLTSANKILYLADNCGELVFDGLLIAEFGREKEITVSVKEQAIINDALLPDALFCGIDKIAKIISNGTACPGTPLPICSKEFQKAFLEADLIISKGQGNFETLSLAEGEAPIYFLLTVKCEVVAAHIAELKGQATATPKIGDLLLMKSLSG